MGGTDRLVPQHQQQRRHQLHPRHMRHQRPRVPMRERLVAQHGLPAPDDSPGIPGLLQQPLRQGRHPHHPRPPAHPAQQDACTGENHHGRPRDLRVQGRPATRHQDRLLRLPQDQDTAREQRPQPHRRGPGRGSRTRKRHLRRLHRTQDSRLPGHAQAQDPGNLRQLISFRG